MSINLRRWIDIHCFGSKLRCWEMILTLVIFCSLWQFFSSSWFWQSVCWRTAEDDGDMTRLIMETPIAELVLLLFYSENLKRSHEMWSIMWNVQFTSDLQIKFLFFLELWSWATSMVFVIFKAYRMGHWVENVKNYLIVLHGKIM